MRFRPCIDIHNGKVKQIKGASLADTGDKAEENFVSDREARFYAALYKEKHLPGGHVIVLNPSSSPYYDASIKEALSALSAYPQGMQYGGGVTDENAALFLDAGASHVIVTSFVFRDGRMDRDNLRKIQRETGKERLVLDLSCRQKDDGQYYVVSDRWQRFTDLKVTQESMEELSEECGEILIHAVDKEGKRTGIDRDLLKLMADIGTVPVTYAGGISSIGDIDIIREEGRGRVDFTVGSALSLFGGDLDLEDVINAADIGF